MIRLLIGILCLSAASIARAAPSQAADSPPNATTGPTTAPAAFLSGDEAIPTMNLPPGFRMELVAEEPMVEHPVAMTFDADGRMWVVEMRSYMPDPEGKDETAPTGRISVLEDTDGDGRADKSTVFMDNLVLPRAIAVVRNEALVGVPPKLLFCRDTNGDGKADEQTVIATDWAGGPNPEIQPNGLLTNLDNWIYNAYYTQRMRFMRGKWISDPIPSFGQWGLSQDDYGRLYHDTNSDYLRGTLVPPQYVDRNPHYRGVGANVQVATTQAVWPSHGTAVNRGYQTNFLRDDWTLRNFTAACGPCIYRGGLFPSEFQGNAFVCEPSANVIRRAILTDRDGWLTAKNAYDNAEFVASTYERFRPVNLYTGPDGALYVIDMHHGLIQHQTHLTTYAKNQYLARELEKHLRTGRIYRIVPENARPFPRPKLSRATNAELVTALSHPNGWWRDTAQRLLVERADYRIAEPLRKLALTGANPLGRMHALWTLEGMGQIEAATIVKAMGDSDGHVRAAAIRLAEPSLTSPRRPTVLPTLLKLAADEDAHVQLQLAFSMSGAGGAEAETLLFRMLGATPQNVLVRNAAITGLRGRELEFLECLLILDDWKTKSAARATVLSELAKCVVLEAKPRRVQRLLDLAVYQTSQYEWRRMALIDGFPEPVSGRRAHPIVLESEPSELMSLYAPADDPLRKSLDKVFDVVHWPGQPGYVPPPPPEPLSPAQQARFDSGQRIYAKTCLQCHKPDGQGQEGIAPPLVDSEWVLGSERVVVRILLKGMQGPLTVNGQTFNLDMPSLHTLSDNDIADVLTYVRREWDHDASPVDSSLVKNIRTEEAARFMPWTERELLKLRESK